MSIPNPNHHRGDILVVDDSSTSRTLLGGILERRGYNVRFAQDGEEALAAVRAVPPDLVLLDLILPRLDGYRVARRLRSDASLPYIPIILITTIGDVDSKVRGLEAGADDFVVKPPDEGELLARVGALLRLKRSQEDLLIEKSKTDLLYQVSRELSAELDLDTLLPRILDLTIRSISASRGSIILLDERGETTRRISFHEDKVVLIPKEVWDKILQDGLASWVIRYREASIVFDTREDPRWIVVQGAHAATRSALAVPLIHGGRVVGVLTVTHEEPGRFTPDHLDLLSSIASQGATVIEKARAYQREQLWARQLRLANEVGRQATSILDPNHLLQEVARLICQAFDYYHVEVALREGEYLVFPGWGCGREEQKKIPLARLALSDEGITTWVARHGKTLLAPDVNDEPRYRFIDELPDTAAELAVPLQVGGEILGVLDVQSDRYGQLTEEEIPLLETLASQVAVALRNAQLFTETRQRLREQTALREAGTVISSTLDLETVLSHIAEQMAQAIDATSAYISTYRPEAKTSTVLAEYIGPQASPEEQVSDLGVTYEEENRDLLATLQANQPAIIHIDDPELLDSSRAHMQQYGAKSRLFIPLQVRDELTGFAEVWESRRRREFTAEEIVLCQAIVQQAAIAIENARLYAATEGERAKLAAILADTADAVVVTDDQGRTLLLNPAAEQAFGVQAQSIVGEPLADVIPNRPLVDLFRRGVEGTPPHVTEVPLPGERTLYASVSRVEGVGYVTVMQDITHLKKLDRMKSEFVATVSHDLRMPLSAIHGYADLLVEETEGKGKDFAQRIKVNARQMAELVENLLDLGKIEAGIELVQIPCRLEHIVKDSVEGASFQAQRREVTLTSAVPTVSHPVLGDPGRLRQVLDNLLSNALKYTPDGGTIVARVREEDDHVIVEVQDTGIGIPREALPRVFEKFCRISSPGMERIPGTGLGLAIVKAIVEQHGGQVWVESELGQGSTFGFSLPTCEETP